METIWIISADSSRARVLEVVGHGRVREIENLVNPKGRLADRDLLADAHPRFRGTDGPGSDRQETSAADHEAELFSKQLHHFLEQARIGHRYDRLILIAPPRFLGLLRKHLGKEVDKLVIGDLHKDLSWFRPDQLEHYLQQHAKEAGLPPA